MRVSGLILCGGQGRRMQGQDKGWVEMAGKPMVEHVIGRFEPQVDELLINANRNIERYQQLKYKIVEDVIDGYQGPLVGILSGMAVCKNHFLVCVPCDCPFFPTDLVARMVDLQQSSDADIVSVTDGERSHPVFALIRTSLQDSLKEYLQSDQRKIDRWYQQHNYQCVEYSIAQNYFDNINTLEQLNESKLRIQDNA